jgi:hypothetical protein
LGVAPSDAAFSAREHVANRLAGCLLLPRQWLIADGAAVEWDLYALKSRYITASHELIARRMLDLPPAVIVTIADHGKITWRRGNSAARTPPMTPPERDAWRAAHELGQPARCEARELPPGVEDVRAWPVHEPEWRREIVRTALADPW